MENERVFSLASAVVAHDFYVDDLLTAGDTIENTVEVCDQVSNILRSGCFELCK